MWGQTSFLQVSGHKLSIAICYCLWNLFRRVSCFHMYQGPSPTRWCHLQNDVGFWSSQGSCATYVGSIGHPQVEHHLTIYIYATVCNRICDSYCYCSVNRANSPSTQHTRFGLIIILWRGRYENMSFKIQKQNVNWVLRPFPGPACFAQDSACEWVSSHPPPPHLPSPTSPSSTPARAPPGEGGRSCAPSTVTSPGTSPSIWGTSWRRWLCCRWTWIWDRWLP